MQRNKNRWIVTWSSLILTLASIAGLATAARAGIKTGDMFPDLAACQLAGALPDRSHDKVVLVDFWASWCGPCQESFPVMNQLQTTYGPRGLRIIAVSVDEKQSDMDKFLKEHAINFTVVRDPKQILVGKADIETMPTSFLLDQTGKVRFMHSGFHGRETEKQYEQEIASLLGPDHK